jgi:ATP-dependent 26S proteasome regulatory subunit
VLGVAALFCCCREVQRILMELLTQMDGFEQNTNVKVRRRS